MSRDKNKTKIAMRKYRRNNREKIMFSQVKKRAKEQGIIVEIEEKDIIIPELCPVLNIQLYNGHKKMIDNSPSIDRIDNSQGYIKNNIRVISWRANAIKGDATLSELEKVRDYMYNNNELK